MAGNFDFLRSFKINTLCIASNTPLPERKTAKFLIFELISRIWFDSRPISKMKQIEVRIYSRGTKVVSWLFFILERYQKVIQKSKIFGSKNVFFFAKLLKVVTSGFWSNVFLLCRKHHLHQKWNVVRRFPVFLCYIIRKCISGRRPYFRAKMNDVLQILNFRDFMAWDVIFADGIKIVSILDAVRVGCWNCGCILPYLNANFEFDEKSQFL